MLTGKVAFITGSNRGIGRAVLEEFARQHSSIVAHARKDTPEFQRMLSEVAAKYNVNIRPIFFDMTDYIAMKAAVMEIIRDECKVDILVNCAGILYEALLQMTPQSVLRNIFEVNFFAPYFLTQMISKLMLRNANGGAIINFSSVTAFDGVEGETAYGASKAALASMSKSLAKELGRFKIRVNCVAPGIVNTDLILKMNPEVIEGSRSSTYLKSLGKPSDVASVVAFLASDAAGHITGQTIRVDGGLN